MLDEMEARFQQELPRLHRKGNVARLKLHRPFLTLAEAETVLRVCQGPNPVDVLVNTSVEDGRHLCIGGHGW